MLAKSPCNMRVSFFSTTRNPDLAVLGPHVPDTAHGGEASALSRLGCCSGGHLAGVCDK